MAEKIEPNLFQLSGGGVKVTYSTSSFDGKPRLSYQKGNKKLEFAGTEIRVDNTEIGNLVTVTVAKTIDRGFTSFSVLIPEVLLAKLGAKQAIKTIGILTEHRLTIGGPVKGPLETYKVIALRGTATRVLFAAAQA